VSVTLLLNASYEPLRIIPYTRAVTLFFLGKVEVVSEYDLRQVRSVSLCIKMPAVVKLTRYVKLKRRTPPLSKTNLLARDEYLCQYCSNELTRGEATIDHVLPRSQAGRTEWTNVVIACSDCNRKKGGRTPEQAKMKLIKKPIQPDWLPVMNFFFRGGSVPEEWAVFLTD